LPCQALRAFRPPGRTPCCASLAAAFFGNAHTLATIELFAMRQLDPLAFYNLEEYLFTGVATRFRENGSLNAFDVLAIATWKAVRARTYVARRLCTLGNGHIEAGAITLASAGSLQKDPKDRFKAVIVELGFGLPMGTAILTVLDQESFSVYDVRVCEELKTDRFRTLVNKTSLESLWSGYLEYVAAVRAACPSGLSLRNCDRYLWARNVTNGLQQVVREGCSAATLDGG
jgi:hypothetical protein